jgi:hypothetical protein
MLTRVDGIPGLRKGNCGAPAEVITRPSVFLGFEEADGAEHGGEGGGFGGDGESGLVDQLGQQSVDVVLGGCESVEDLDEVEGGAERGVLGTSEVGDVEMAPRAKNPEDLGEGAEFLVAREVMKDEAGEDVIERRVGKWESVGHDLVEVDVESGAGGFVTSDAKDLGIGVDGGNAGLGMLRLEEKSEGAGAAAEIEDAVLRLERGLLNESRFEGPLANGGLDDEVVPGGEGAVAKSGDVGGLHAGLILRQPE